LGGTSLNNTTANDQTGSLIPPNQSNYVPFSQYNLPLYGDSGFVIPPEFQRLNTPTPVTPVTLPGFPQLSGLNAVQRATAASTYLYPALAKSEGRVTDLTKDNINTTLNHITSQDLATIKSTLTNSSRKVPNNLHILSEVLVTNLILDKGGKKRRAIGVQYLEGYNIYQAGRNNHIERAGFGGTSGDARANAILSELKGTKQVYARKEVILCGGFINTPQILLLSGIGDKSELRQAGIKSKHHLPGVGKNIVDNQEVFIFWQIQNNRPGNVALSAKSKPSVPATNFELVFGGASDTQMLETADPFVQKNWAGLKNLGAVDVVFGRNDFNNLLNAGESISNPPTTYQPFYSNPTKRLGMTVELEEDNRSRGFLRLVSKDPTVPPFIVSNFLTNPQDEQDFVDVFMNNVFPILLALGNGTNGTVATATATVVAGVITNLTLTNGGTGYTVPPLVFFAGATGTTPTTPAIATATISGGSVTGLTLVNGGSGFTGPVIVTLGAGYFQQLLDPSPADILKNGSTNLTSINDVDITKLRTWLQNRVGAHHGGGSCKMGLKTDPTAVVNQKGQVYGIKGLRVCDMSVVPISIRWPNINLYVIAEKFAQDIKNKYKM
jgi:choline dehydrogenase-like flavoprotein